MSDAVFQCPMCQRGQFCAANEEILRKTMDSNKAYRMLAELADGLVYVSETDEPVEVVRFDGNGSDVHQWLKVRQIDTFPFANGSHIDASADSSFINVQTAEGWRNLRIFLGDLGRLHVSRFAINERYTRFRYFIISNYNVGITFESVET